MMESEATSLSLALARFADHTYTDYSEYIKEGGALEKHKKSEKNFPAILHKILSDERCSHIISWMPHGRSFIVQNKELLIDEAIPEYFGPRRPTKYTSFTKQLSQWGFKRLYKPGPDQGSYYHECFLQGIPGLTVLMRRVTSGKGRAVPNIQGEPDFYAISEKSPLPIYLYRDAAGIYSSKPKFDVDGKKEASVDTITESSAKDDFDSNVAAATSRDTSDSDTGKGNQYLGTALQCQDETGYTQPESLYQNNNLDIGNNLHHSTHVQTQYQVPAQASAKLVLPSSTFYTLHASTAAKPPSTPADVATDNQEYLLKTPKSPTWGVNNDNLRDSKGFDCFFDSILEIGDGNDVDGISGKFDWTKSPNNLAVNSNIFEHNNCVSQSEERSNRKEGQPSTQIAMFNQEHEISFSNDRGPILQRFQSSLFMPFSSYQSTTTALPQQNLVSVFVPSGKLGIVISDNITGAGAGSVSLSSMPTCTRVCAIQSTSVLAGKVQLGDELDEIDGKDVSQLHSKQIMSMIASRSDFERVLVFKSFQCDNDSQSQEWI